MSNVKNDIMKEKIIQIESALYKRFLKISENINIFFYDILNGYSISIWISCMSTILEYFNLLIFPFKELVRYLNNILSILFI